MRTDEEIKFRVSRSDKALIQRAAELEGVSLSEYLRAPAVERALEVVANVEFRASTVLLPSSFEDLLRALDEPAEPVPALLRAARRAREASDKSPIAVVDS